MFENIFEAELREQRIFRDQDVLSPHYVPSELPHREKEIKEVTRIIAPVLRNQKPTNLFIYGKTGTGKTCVVKYVTKKLMEFVEDPTKNTGKVNVRVVYLNCRILNTMYQVMLKLLENEALNDRNLKNIPLRDRQDGSLKGMDPVDLYDRLLNVVSSNNINLLIILDELDMIKKNLDDLIYSLTRINDELQQGKVSIIGLTNDMKLKKRLNPRSLSTLCEEEKVFPPYNALQLKTILHQRVVEGFWPNSIDNATIARIAAFAAQDGDARYALRLLKKSADLAEKDGSRVVSPEYVEYAKRAVEEDIMKEAVITLPEHQQILIYTIAALASQGGIYRRLEGESGGDLTSGEVYEAYEVNCKALNRTPRTIRQFSQYINELEMLGFITTVTSGKGMRGNTRFIRLGYNPEEIKSIVRKCLGVDGQPN